MAIFRCTTTGYSKYVHNPATKLPVYTDFPADERQQLVVSLWKETLVIRKEFADLINLAMEEFRRCPAS